MSEVVKVSLVVLNTRTGCSHTRKACHTLTQLKGVKWIISAELRRHSTLSGRGHRSQAWGNKCFHDQRAARTGQPCWVHSILQANQEPLCWKADAKKGYWTLGFVLMYKIEPLLLRTPLYTRFPLIYCIPKDRLVSHHDLKSPLILANVKAPLTKHVMPCPLESEKALDFRIN